MKKKILVSILSLLLISVTGCNDSNESSNTTPSQKNKAEQSESKQKNTNFNEAKLAQKIEKGNLWTYAIEEEFGNIIRKKTSVISGGLNPNILNNTKSVLDSFSSDKNMTLNLPAFKAIDNKTDLKNRAEISGSLLSLDITFSMHFNNSELNNIKEAFDYMATLSPEIPELDAAGIAYGKSYVDLYEKMIKLGDYAIIKKTYRLDDYAQMQVLYDDAKKAYIKLIDEKEKLENAYENYYQDMHVEELKLVKEKGLIIRFQIMNSLDLLSNTIESMGPEKIDLKVLSDEIAKIEAESVELEKLFGNEVLLNKENIKSSDYAVKEYLRKYQQIVIELKVLEKKVKEGKNVSNDIDTIFINYESLIKDYNSLITK